MNPHPLAALYDRYDEIWSELQVSGNNTNKLAKQLAACSDQIDEAEANLNQRTEAA
jgi:hypothetical protein